MTNFGTRIRKAAACILSFTCCAAMGFVPLQAAEVMPSPVEHYALAREAASEGVVLVKNEQQALPFSAGEKIAVFGMNQLDYVDGGGGAGYASGEYKVSLLDGLESKKNISLFRPLAKAYRAAYEQDDSLRGQKAQIAISDEMMQDAVDFADTAIFAVGRYTAEGTDASDEEGRWHSPNDYNLSDDEQALFDRVVQAGFEKIVVVLNTASVIDSSFFADNPSVDAAIICYLAGMEGGSAMADILCGDVNPSGKLTDTWAKSYEDYPTADFHASSDYVNYTEDIYVGYRYFSTIPGAAEKVNYPFGFGLSYTEFSIGQPELTISGDGIQGDVTAKVTVTNTGQRAGKETLQLYYSAPQGVLGKPALALGAFAKTDLLEPGESQELTLTFPIRDMASYDDTGKNGHASAYVLEAGSYTFHLGNAVNHTTACSQTFELAELEVVEQLSPQLTPNLLEKRLLADGSYEELPTLNTDPEIAQIPAEGSLRIECENAAERGEGSVIQRYFDETGTLGTAVGYFNQGRWLTYPLQVETAGRYKVTLRAANGHGAPLNNFLGVQVNGSRQNVSVNIPVTGTEESFNQWHTYVELDPFYITLPAGEATLRLECQVGEGPNLDYMTIERTDEPEPEDPLLQKLSAEHPVQILAKNYKDKDPSVGTETNDGKVSIAWWQENRWIEYLLEVPEAGTYSLTLNGANGHGAPVTDFVKVEVNGAEQPVDITASDAGQDNWFGFRDLAPCQISLPAGRVTLRLTHTKGAFESFNLYSLSLEKLPDEAVGLQYISDEQPTLVEAEACADAAEGLIWEQNNTSAGQFLDGRWLDYQLYVPTAGAYSLTLLAAHNLDHTVTDFLEVTVGDGQPMAIADSLPAAGGWYAFQDFGPFPLELPAGTVTLRLKNTSSDGVNLDGFRLEKQPDAQTAGAAQLVRTAAAPAAAPAAGPRPEHSPQSPLRPQF